MRREEYLTWFEDLIIRAKSLPTHEVGEGPGIGSFGGPIHYSAYSL